MLLEGCWLLMVRNFAGSWPLVCIICFEIASDCLVAKILKRIKEGRCFLCWRAFSTVFCVSFFFLSSGGISVYCLKCNLDASSLRKNQFLIRNVVATFAMRLLFCPWYPVSFFSLICYCLSFLLSIEWFRNGISLKETKKKEDYWLIVVHLFNSGFHGQEWLAVSTNDLEVKNAANHAVKSMQRKSNSLFPYELLEILQAKAKVGIFYTFLSIFGLILFVICPFSPTAFFQICILIK